MITSLSDTLSDLYNKLTGIIPPLNPQVPSSLPMVAAASVSVFGAMLATYSLKKDLHTFHQIDKNQGIATQIRCPSLQKMAVKGAVAASFALIAVGVFFQELKYSNS